LVAAGAMLGVPLLNVLEDREASVTFGAFQPPTSANQNSLVPVIRVNS
jgi:hypothetical protein